MEKKIPAIFFCAIVLLAAGCGKQAEPETSEVAATALTETSEVATTSVTETSEVVEEENPQMADAKDSYRSEDGWSVRYNSELVDLEEGEDYVRFTYNEDANATNRIQFSYHPNTSTDIVLADATKGYDREEITRSEGYFAGQADIWAFHADVVNDGKYSTRGYTAVEHNGGVLLVERRGSIESDEEKGTLISDTMSAILDSFEFSDHEQQEEYDYIPGRYELVNTETSEVPVYIVLGMNHTGSLGYSDPVDIVWYSRDSLIRENKEGGATYYYSIEGEALYLQVGERWIEYDKDMGASTSIGSTSRSGANVESFRTYENKEGWFVYYDADLFTFNERWDGVDFIYKETENEDEWLKITYEEYEDTEDILKDVAKEYDSEQIVRSEGYVGGGKEAWGITLTVPAEGSGSFRRLTVVEHNGGVLLFDRPVSQSSSQAQEAHATSEVAGTDDTETSEVTGVYEGILDTFTFTDHDKQQEYEDVPGKYILNDKKLQKAANNYPGYVRLNDDHSGVLGGGEEKEIVWYGMDPVIKETGPDGAAYSYRIEDDTLYVDMNGEWVEFNKKDEDD